VTPTEAQIQAYELQVADRASRRQARRPAVHAFRNLFGWIALGFVVYIVAAFVATVELGVSCSNSGSCPPSGENPPMQWGAPAAVIAILAYIGLVAFALSVKNSDGHKIRCIARYRRAQLYPGHPWLQYRIRHPYMAHVFVIGGMLAVLNVVGRRKL